MVNYCQYSVPGVLVLHIATMTEAPVSPVAPKGAPRAQETALDAERSTPPSLSSNEHINNEKGPALNNTTVDLDRAAETGDGYVLDEATLRQKLGLAADVPLKKSKKGVVLIPQPTDDPEDPLNWTALKKAAILLVLGVNAATSDYSAATGASALLPQATQWQTDPNTVNHATAG